MKTLEEIKKIWKKSLIEVTNEVFDDVIKTATDETNKSELDATNILACMSMVRDKMEAKLKEHGITDDDTQYIKEHDQEWIQESMPWLMELIADRLHIKEALIKKGDNHE